MHYKVASAVNITVPSVAKRSYLVLYVPFVYSDFSFK